MNKRHLFCLCFFLCVIVLLMTSCNPTRRVSRQTEEFIVEFSDDGSRFSAEVMSKEISHKEKTNTPSKKVSSKDDKSLSEIDRLEKEDAQYAKHYQLIKEWLGVRHRIGGNTKNGIDCSGFVGVLYQEFYNISLPHSSSAMAAKLHLLKNKELLEMGDLVFFCIRGKRVSHVGYYLKDDEFVHASTSQGVIISSMNESYWKKYFCGFGKKEDVLKQFH